MASKVGRKVVFHGAFKTKAGAVRKEHRVPHSYVRAKRIKGHMRYMVLTRRRRG